MWIVFLQLVFSSVWAGDGTERVVTISQGPVVGYKDKEFDIYAFKNIPYATVPTGVHRFKAPLPPPSWDVPLDAADKEILCPQGPFMAPQMYSDNQVMQEECLIANIYVPNTAKDNIPVVVYVHGGKFAESFGNVLTPKALVDSKRIIAVNFNYRLGAHGFLCLGTNDIPGNAGMKDQIALLRWVQKNIKAFGGNPEDVTVVGYSAGAACADLLMLSNTTDGLFHRVIPESGASIAPFSVQSNPIENAKEYAKLLRFNNVDDINALEEYFKNISLEQLNSVNTLERLDSTFLLSPCVEGQTNEESFLEDDPVSILKSGKYKKLPMLYGITDMEGLFRIQFFDSWKDRMNDNFADFLPADLQFENEKEKETVANNIKQFYFGNNEVNEDNILSFINYFTDIIFGYPTLRSVKLQVAAGNNEVYLYEYSFVDENTPYVPFTRVRGAHHCAQTLVLLDSSPLMSGGHVDKKSYIMREIWLNFMTSGKPTHTDIPAWPAVGSDRSSYMLLNETSRLEECLLKERAEFWDGIYEQYYRWPKPPLNK